MSTYGDTTGTGEPEAVVFAQALREGLVGPHRLLYHRSAGFHAAIDTLAQMLPAMVNGLASSASADGQAVDELVAGVKQGDHFRVGWDDRP